MKYRPEIDGLRAIAVLPVIFFHAGFPLFKGGFIGVDVFFVISGFLITMILLEAIHEDRLSMIDFYERRARRILPVLFIVLLGSALSAWFLFGPTSLKSFAATLIGSSLFYNNFVAWRLTEGYFSADSELMPLLHTWSLGVEEQYYLFFPLLLYFGHRHIKRFYPFIIIGIATLSFSICIWGAMYEPAANFYLTPSRIWEIFIGSLGALYLNHVGSIKPRDLLSGLGLIAIILSYCIFDNDTPYPSYPTLLATVGVLCVLLFTNAQSKVGRLLSHRFLIHIGLISYSAYLWHQPIFAFYRSYSLVHMPSDIEKIILILLTLILATFTWKYIETPFRNRRRFPSALIWKLSTIWIFLPTLLGFHMYFSDGYPERLNNDSELTNLKKAEAESKREQRMSCKSTPIESIKNCTFKKSSTFAIFGDSHAQVLSKGLSKHRVSHYLSTLAGCPPFIDLKVGNGHANQDICAQHVNDQLQLLQSNSDIQTVVLLARWSLYTSGSYDSPMNKYFLFDEQDTGLNQHNSQRVFAVSVQKTLEIYRSMKLDVLILLQPPQQRRSIRTTVEDLVLRGRSSTQIEETLFVSISDHLQLQSYNRDIFNQQKNRLNVTLINVDDLFCNQQRCTALKNKEILYLDQNHLSIFGATQVAKRIIPYLSKSNILKPSRSQSF